MKRGVVEIIKSEPMENRGHSGNVLFHHSPEFRVFSLAVAPSDFDVTIYHEVSLKDLAEQFVEEGLFGDVPESLASYIDYDAIARDLGYDYTEATIAGFEIVYRCD